MLFRYLSYMSTERKRKLLRKSAWFLSAPILIVLTQIPVLLIENNFFYFFILFVYIVYKIFWKLLNIKKYMKKRRISNFNLVLNLNKIIRLFFLHIDDNWYLFFVYIMPENVSFKWTDYARQKISQKPNDVCSLFKIQYSHRY